MPLNSSDQQPIVDAHNAYRSDSSVKAQNLVWDATLATGAQSWADTIVTTGIFDHSPDGKSGKVGENLAMTTASQTPAQMVDIWGKTLVNGRSEQAQFKPGIMPNVSKDGGPVGHYTQVISYRSTKVGCGLASNGTNTYLVCRYDPPGNLTGAGYPSPQSVTLAQVAVADSKTAFGVDSSNNVYMYSSSDGTNWTPQMSIAGQQMTQVSIASDYTVCGLDPSGNAWLYSINDNAWTKMPAGPVAFVSVSGGASNNIWAVGTDGTFYQNTGSGWTKIASSRTGKQVSVASDGTVCVLDSQQQIWRYDTTQAVWSQVSPPGSVYIYLSCGSATSICTIGTNNGYFQYDGKNWNVIGAYGLLVSVASDGTIWGIWTDNRVTRYLAASKTWTPLVV